MQLLLEIIKEIVSDGDIILAKKEALQDEENEYHQKIISSLIPLFKERLKDWVPKIGDSLVNISFEDRWCYELIVISVSESWVKAKEGDRDYIHNINLDDETSDDEVPVIVIPVSLYLELKHCLPFEFLPTPVLVDGCLKFNLPQWAK
ncbi:MAG: hypothetical protein JXK16_06340 [Thiotrichales bacterium]|nr:hypothetical protein [Thiotrichales bacterium]